ncbi:hypothetical protein BDZ89DRAFT_1060697 [Hymenopellis radicata]|nr:hypothetical protein BDZ89DRAFT_1060697 [Hymenopellis radicata]
MSSSVTKDDAIIILVSILLPPIAVIMMKRPTEDVLINVVLTLFGWILGIVHALYLLNKKKQSWF